MIKKLGTFFLFFSLIFFTFGYSKPEVYEINAEKNAIDHNNRGLKNIYEENYAAAIQEFCLAISLNPKTQATSVYYNNLGETYMKVGAFREAQSCFEMAIKQYNLNFLYYKNLVSTFKAQNCIKDKIKIYKAKGEKNPMNMVVLGLLYIENGDKKNGIIKLDEFCMREPDLITSTAVKNYIKQILAK